MSVNPGVFVRGEGPSACARATSLMALNAMNAMKTPVVMAALAFGLSACSPALNWRQVDLAEADGLRTRLPCKPDRVERVLRLEAVEAPQRLVMWSCEAAGARWVVSAIRVSSVHELSQVLRAWSAATQANLAWADRRARQQDPAASPPAWRLVDQGATDVAGMTPHPDARAWRVEGLKPLEGGGSQASAVSAWHFSHGLTVVQAAVWQGAEPLPRENNEDAVTIFRQSLHFPG
jgi:hypothetical protein